ncbi:hypothetical protein ABFV05_020006 [Capra hircus]
MNPLVNTEVDKEDNVSQQDDTTFQLLPEYLSYDESSQSDHFQEDLADSTEDEVSGPDVKDNIPDLVMTQCIQFGKKRSDQPELLPSFTNCTQPAPMEDPIQLQGIETPFTPIRRAHQRKIQACLYCSHAGGELGYHLTDSHKFMLLRISTTRSCSFADPSPNLIQQ